MLPVYSTPKEDFKGRLVDSVKGRLYKAKVPARYFTESELDLTKILFEGFRKSWRAQVAENPEAFDLLIRENAWEETGDSRRPLRLKEAVEKKFARKMVGVSSVTVKAVKDKAGHIVENLYTLAGQDVAGRMGEKWVFGAVDKDAVRMAQKNLLYWVGESYENAIRGRINRAAETAAKMGLGRADFGRLLEKEFAGVVGRSSAYWNVVSSAALGRTRSFSRLLFMEKVGVETYEIINPMDERTTEICRELDGTTFQVERAREIVQEVMDAEDPETVKTVQPWLVWDDKAGGFYKQHDADKTVLPKDAASLADAGVMLPPFHGRCRSDIIYAGAA